jgi:hypothetical protein
MLEYMALNTAQTAVNKNSAPSECPRDNSDASGCGDSSIVREILNEPRE